MRIATRNSCDETAAVRRAGRRCAPIVAAGLCDLGYFVSTIDRGAVVLYRRPEGPIGMVKITVYCRPHERDPDRPFIARWHVDHGMVRMPKRSFDDLQASPSRRAWGASYWQRTDGQQKLELSCLPREIGALAPWLPAWIAARDRGVPHPACPVQLSRDEPVRDYGWTSAGETLIEAWQRSRKPDRIAQG